MAYTRIHAIKATVQKALKYICNPEKTNGELLIDSFACGIETAHYDFRAALSKSSGVGDKQAFPLIQSFAPGGGKSRFSYGASGGDRACGQAVRK